MPLRILADVEHLEQGIGHKWSSRNTFAFAGFLPGLIEPASELENFLKKSKVLLAVPEGVE